jgi:hypothetical protein
MAHNTNVSPLTHQLTWWILILPIIGIIGISTQTFSLILFAHVMSASLWTGADIFLGFILGPVWKHLTPSQKSAVIEWLTPKKLLYLPIIALTTGFTGWYLAQDDGFLKISSPLFPWIVAAGVFIIILTVVGLGFLTPNDWKVYKEVHKDQPDPDKIFNLNRYNRRYAAVLGLVQVLVIIVMVHLALAP